MGKLNALAQKLSKDTLNPFKFKLWTMKELPSLSYWGVKVTELNAEQCSVTIPYKHRNKNPFQSIYFAAQAGAAEFSTGGLLELYKAGNGKVSMLVVDLNMKFTKKAASTVTFTCTQGLEVEACINNLEVGDKDKLILTTTGVDEAGDVVSIMEITWSLLRKS